MDPEEQRIAAEEERLRKLAGGGSDEPGAEADDEMSTSTVPPDDQLPPSDDEIRAANEAGGGASNGEEPAAGEGDPDEDEEPVAPPPVRGQTAFERRISQLAAKNRQKDAEIAARDAEIARLRAGGDPPAPEDSDAPPQRQNYGSVEEFNRAVAAEAARQSAVAEFNRKCNVVEEKGSKLGARWVAAKSNLALLDDNGSIPMDLLAPALETENPHRIIMMLGEDPDRAAELLAMNPNRRAVEIAKMDLTEGRTPPPPPRRSAAPPPPDPIRGRTATASTSALPSDKDSDAEWLRKRNLQLAARAATAR